MSNPNAKVEIIGNLTGDPELRFTPNGAAVANFTIASTPRVFNKSTNEWEDGEPLFMRASAWRGLAENIAESLSKGVRVWATGSLKQRSYETREGEKRTVIEMEVDDIGPSLKYAKATVTKTSRGGAAPAAAAQPASQDTYDPFAAPAMAGAGAEAPF